MQNDSTGKLVIRAKYPSSSVWVFLAKDSFNRRDSDTGSVYYWSNNLAIAPVLFDSEEEGFKKLNRLKRVKEQVSEAEIFPYVAGKQIFYLDGRII